MLFAADSGNAVEMALFDQILSQLAGRHGRGRAHRAGPALGRGAGRAARRLARPWPPARSPWPSRSCAAPASSRRMTCCTWPALQGQDHLRAISQRSSVSSAVSDAIVARGDDATLGVLLRNEGAVLSRAAHETVVDQRGGQSGPA
ncbi:DUF2336 domain-containing protein [Caulobacter segnis]